jgi:hypothetical protein
LREFHEHNCTHEGDKRMHARKHSSHWVSHLILRSLVRRQCLHGAGQVCNGGQVLRSGYGGGVRVLAPCHLLWQGHQARVLP